MLAVIQIGIANLVAIYDFGNQMIENLFKENCTSMPCFTLILILGGIMPLYELCNY